MCCELLGRSVSPWCVPDAPNWGAWLWTLGSLQTSLHRRERCGCPGKHATGQRGSVGKRAAAHLELASFDFVPREGLLLSWSDTNCSAKALSLSPFLSVCLLCLPSLAPDPVEDQLLLKQTHVWQGTSVPQVGWPASYEPAYQSPDPSAPAIFHLSVSDTSASCHGALHIRPSLPTRVTWKSRVPECILCPSAAVLFGRVHNSANPFPSTLDLLLN